ncbi:MAG: cadherin domain-containing protein, partial [Candidatus Atribacteria bacterium]|nr:cadherin domain-containing protein [Candidatus Atribacteria bacterium]
MIPGIGSTARNGVDVNVFNGDWARLQLEFVISGQDTNSPTVNAFCVTPDSVVAGNSFTISYTVSDSGGSGLKQVELWRTSDPAGMVWPQPPNPIAVRSISDNGPVSGTFYDGSALPAGTYWYGLHVMDKAGNWNDEQNSNTGHLPGDFGPVMVAVQQPLPDLRGNTFDSQEPLTAGQTSNVTFSIDNNGSAAAGGFWVDFYVSADSTISTSDKYLGDYYLSGAPAGSCTLPLTKSLTLPGRNDAFWNSDGTYYIGMIVDSTGAVAESDETNNRNRGDGYDRDAVLITGTGNQAPVVNNQALGPVAENIPNGTVVGSVAASDPDAGQSLTYAITGGNTANAFAINATTGRVTVANSAALNFEAMPSFALTVQVTDNGTPALSDTGTVTINLTNVNESPTDIALSSNSVAENQPVGTTVGSLSTTDPDAGNTFTYDLVSGTGSTDNGAFTITGNSLRTAAVFDYEAKKSYSIRVRSTDQGGLWMEKQFTVNVTNANEAPTDIALSGNSVAENQPSGTAVGAFSTTDPDTGNTFTYSLVGGTGSADNGVFSIVGSTLKTVAVFDYETRTSYSIRVRSTDQGGLYTEKAFGISVTNVDDSPPMITSVRLNGVDGRSVSAVEPGGIGVQTIEVTFSEPVNFGVGAVTIQTFPAGATLIPASTSGSGTNKMTITFNLASVVDTWLKVRLNSSA